jgi:hypothetical protein
MTGSTDRLLRLTDVTTVVVNGGASKEEIAAVAGTLVRVEEW